MKLRKLRARELCLLALLTALNIVMAEIMKFPIIPKVLELSFGFVPIAVTGMLFGPVPAIVVAVAADILGGLMFNFGEFFPGFTLTAFMTGLFYGLFLHKEDTPFWKILVCQALVSLVCFAGLNTLWTRMMGYGRSTQFVITRLTVNAISYPVYVFVVYLLTRYRKTLERAIRL